MIIYDGQITKNFNIREFVCKDNFEILLNEQVLDHIFRLQKFRSWYMRPMVVSSGYRTKEYNAKVGGSPNSKHILGIATDFLLPLDELEKYNEQRIEEFYNNVKNKWLELCAQDNLGGGVGFYDKYIHLDSRSKGDYSSGSYAFWDKR